MALPIEVRANRRQLLGMPPARFLRDYWQKRPLLIRNAFAEFTAPLSPDDLAGLACEELALSRFVIHDAQRNRWTLRNGPFDESSFAQLPSSDWTLLVQDVDKWDMDVAALLARFDFIPAWRLDDVMVSYAVDGGGVGAHLDQYDVFLLQGIGPRRWRIDTDPRAPSGSRDDAELKLLRTFCPSHEWVLHAGDMLYLPPGVPHEGTALGECMTYSIGMRAPSVAEMTVDFAEHLAASLPESLRYADPDLRPTGDDGEIDAASLRRARKALGALARSLDDAGFAAWFGCFITAWRSARPATPPARKLRAETLAAGLARSVFVRNPWSRFAWSHTRGSAILYVAGEAHPCPPGWARALAGRDHRIDGKLLAGLSQRAIGAGLLAALANAGHLAVRRA